MDVKKILFGRSRFIKVSILNFSGVVKFILMSDVCSGGVMLLSIAVVEILVLINVGPKCSPGWTNSFVETWWLLEACFIRLAFYEYECEMK